MAKFYVTYGNGTKQAQKFSVVERENYEEARDYVFRAIGSASAFIYYEDDWNLDNQTLAQKWGLSEIPLQAHEKY